MSVPNKFREPPKPEDARPLYAATGEVADGMVRVEVIGNHNGRCWASNSKRLFKGDVVDLTEEDFQILDKLNYVKLQRQAPKAATETKTLSMPDHKK